MKKRIVIFLCSIFISITGLLFAPQINPVYAEETNTIDTTETIEETPATPEDQPDETTPDTETPTTEEENPVSDATCYDQVGAIGWLICPTTGALAKAIDFIYGGIEYLVKVNPISTENDSPIYLVWEYIRNITNILFIIFILVVVFSQVTGFGISNYGIKRVLPRVIIAAILVNLSYIICAIAVDLSNIIGSSLSSVFTSIQDVAMAGEATHVYTDVEQWTTGILAGGAVIGGVSIAFAAGAVWLLLPVIFAGIISVITAFLTMAARQALIVILIMVAPLALVAYLLPNTEPWFKKWKALLLQMLIFYPMFSVLFGASQLISWVILHTASQSEHPNVFAIVLSIAVQVLPLFFAFSLMKMSKTILGNINNAVQKITSRPQEALKGFASLRSQRKKQQYLADPARRFDVPRRLAQFMSGNKAKVEADIKEAQNTVAKRNRAKVAQAFDPEKRNIFGRQTARSRRRQNRHITTAETKALVDRVDNDYAQGLSSADFNNKSDKKRHDSIKARGEDALTATTVQATRKLNIAAADTAFVASAIDQGYKDQSSDIYKQIVAAHGGRGEEGINNVLAHAISAKTKVDSDTKAAYNTLFNQMPKTQVISEGFHKSIVDKNYNQMEAAIENLAARGDYDLIIKGLMDEQTMENMDLNMQKHLADTIMKYKNDSAPIAMYAKALNIRRGKHAADPDKIAEFISFRDFALGERQTGDNDATAADELTLSHLVGEINDPAVAATQDRNTFKYLLEMAQEGQLRIDPKNPESMLGFKVKQLRSAACSGRMDGEQLGNLNALLTGGYSAFMKLDPSSSKRQSQEQWFNDHSELIQANIMEYTSKMSGSQLASMKESTFNAINDTLNALYPDAGQNEFGINNVLANEYLGTAIRAIERPSAATMRGSMNTEIARKLGIEM